ncbi:hypothetical protein [Anatilimnocola floriformis]|uniref:hypothetical protein n=1 Tax=Anatilimnocola floriformis TaxID=2948575 RepID=UPI0020C3611F|nr:hypothetical protein [Anatilimnocola floriformis]
MKRRPAHRAAAHRSAFTILEMTIASAMFVACALVVAQLLHLIARQERATDARQAALRAVANRLDVLQAQTWEQLAVRVVTDEAAPEDVLLLLKTATMHSEVVALDDDASRQIRVWVEWRDPAGNRVQPIELSAWKHRPAPVEEQP